MALRFDDRHAMLLVGPHLFPGEQALSRARGVEKPWYSLIFSRLGALMWSYWLVVATNQRLLLVQHGGLLSGFSGKRTESLAWGEIDHLSLGWGLLTKNLHIRSGSRRLSRTLNIPRTWMRANIDGAKGIVRAWQQRRSLRPDLAP